MIRYMRCTPETPLQCPSIIKESRLEAEVFSKHAVQKTPMQIPFQGLGEHELLAQAQAGGAHVQRQDTFVQHAYEVVLLAHDARHHIVLCQVPHYAQPGGVLDLHSAPLDAFGALTQLQMHLHLMGETAVRLP